MEIKKITINSRYHDEAVNIFYNWWGKDIKKISLDNIVKSYKDKENEKLPVIYGIIINDTLIGLYEINEKDDIDGEIYTPYLANVYVKPSYRGQGFGKILILDSLKKAKELGFSKLYLHTRIEGLYESFGFEFFKEVDTKYGKKRIYVVDIV